MKYQVILILVLISAVTLFGDENNTLEADFEIIKEMHREDIFYLPNSPLFDIYNKLIETTIIASGNNEDMPDPLVLLHTFLKEHLKDLSILMFDLNNPSDVTYVKERDTLGRPTLHSNWTDEEAKSIFLWIYEFLRTGELYRTVKNKLTAPAPTTYKTFEHMSNNYFYLSNHPQMLNSDKIELAGLYDGYINKNSGVIRQINRQNKPLYEKVSTFSNQYNYVFVDPKNETLLEAWEKINFLKDQKNELVIPLSMVNSAFQTFEKMTEIKQTEFEAIKYLDPNTYNEIKNFIVTDFIIIESLVIPEIDYNTLNSIEFETLEFIPR